MALLQCVYASRDSACSAIRSDLRLQPRLGVWSPPSMAAWSALAFRSCRKSRQLSSTPPSRSRSRSRSGSRSPALSPAWLSQPRLQILGPARGAAAPLAGSHSMLPRPRARVLLSRQLNSINYVVFTLSAIPLATPSFDKCVIFFPHRRLIASTAVPQWHGCSASAGLRFEGLRLQ